eukprot:scaffold314069_cov33-Tisochrysis_lutea.AAC.1
MGRRGSLGGRKRESAAGVSLSASSPHCVKTYEGRRREEEEGEEERGDNDIGVKSANLTITGSSP